MKTVLKNPEAANAKAIGLMFFEDVKELTPIQKIIDEKSFGIVSGNILKNFEAKFKKTMLFPLENGVKIAAVGLGKKEEFSIHKLREASAKLTSCLKQLENVAAIELVDCDNIKSSAFETALGAGMDNYEFDKYKTKKPEKLETLELLYFNSKEVEEGILKANIINNAMDFTKNLVFESAEIMTPSKAAEVAAELSKEYGIECKVYDKKQLKEMNFNTFLAVGQGSAQEPKFIHLTYKSENPKKKIALIGKGITFDSGGLDIKPPSSMLTMKTDMTGCATVLGVIKAICELKPDIELHVMSALCENMPSGSSYKVGDVIVSKSGKTIEVDNTDAEGRLTLADVLTYADDINPDEVIDIATLTGAVIVALGDNITGIMGNNQETVDDFIKCAECTGERVWQLPLYDDLMESLKSDIADMKNTGSRHAGSSVAGRFLQNFTKSNNWLHIDIAGTAYTDKPHKEIKKGATGAMLRTLVCHLAK